MAQVLLSEENTLWKARQNYKSNKQFMKQTVKSIIVLNAYFTTLITVCQSINSS